MAPGAKEKPKPPKSQALIYRISLGEGHLGTIINWLQNLAWLIENGFRPQFLNFEEVLGGAVIG